MADSRQVIVRIEGVDVTVTYRNIDGANIEFIARFGESRNAGMMLVTGPLDLENNIAIFAQMIAEGVVKKETSRLAIEAHFGGQ